MTAEGADGAQDKWPCDVLVVGAGPAGTAAAIEGARRGLDVVVVDKARFPRDKCCGDGLTTAALRHLDDLGLQRSELGSWIEVTEVHLRGPGGRSTSFPLPTDQGTFAAVCRRSELDLALVTLAHRSGATVLEGHELRDMRSAQDHVVALVDGIELRARFAIAADGMWSTARKLLGAQIPRYRGEWHAFRQYFRHVSPQATRELMVWFEPDLLPGYAWSFPLGDGSANVGFGIQRGRGLPTQAMKELWPDLLSRSHVTHFLGADARPEGPHRAWPIPARLGRMPLTVGRVLFAGDAAAATDPLTGEGIGQALETGRAAMQAIVEGRGDNPAGVTARYRRDLRLGMQRDHRLARSLSAVMAHPRLADGAIAVAGATGWSRRRFARWLFEDYPRAVMMTPHRWARDLFSRPGAFVAAPTATEVGPGPALSSLPPDVGE
jgi:geranylgeranyl reductase family protein